MVIRRIVVDFEEDGQGQKPILAEVDDVVLAGLADDGVFFFESGVLVKLGEAFVEPDRNPVIRLAKHVVGVLVVNRGEGVVAFGVEAKEDVVSVLGAEEEAGEIELIFAEVGFGLEGAETLFIAAGDDDDRSGGIVAGLGHDDAEDGAHTLELYGNAAGIAFAGVGDDGEVLGLELEPVRGTLCKDAKGCQKEHREAEDRVAHGFSEDKRRFGRAEENVRALRDSKRAGAEGAAVKEWRVKETHVRYAC